MTMNTRVSVGNLDAVITEACYYYYYIYAIEVSKSRGIDISSLLLGVRRSGKQ